MFKYRTDDEGAEKACSAKHAEQLSAAGDHQSNLQRYQLAENSALTWQGILAHSYWERTRDRLVVRKEGREVWSNRWVRT